MAKRIKREVLSKRQKGEDEIHEAIRIPQDRRQAIRFLGKIGDKQGKIAKIRAELDEDINKRKQKAQDKVDQYDREIDELFNGLYVYSEKHRARLLKGLKTKSVKWSTGEVGWHDSSPAVAYEEGYDEKDILANIRKARKARELIQKKESVRKNVIRSNPELAKKIRGVYMEQHEDFFAKPSKTKLEITRTVLKKETGQN